MKVLAFFLLCCVSMQAQTFTVLHQFRGKLDGAIPVAGVTLDAQGNVYGTTESGGSKLKAGFGVIFEVSQQKKETIVLRFNGRDGKSPMVAITFDAQGNIYGTTQVGGPGNSGVVYKVDTITKKPVVLHYWPKHSHGPQFPLVVDQVGNVYGSSYGGDVFEIDAAGQYKVLHMHTDDAVSSPLILAADGNLYGTATGGDFGMGQIFRMDQQGTWTVLYSFPANIGSPLGQMFMVQNGNFFGALTNYPSCGSVYEVTAQGQITILHTFTGPDGCMPNGLTGDANGVLYGMTYKGGAHNAAGTVFSLNRGQFKTLHIFKKQNGGAFPAAGLTLDADGNLYGTAQSGGLYGFGTVFKIAP